MGPKETTEASDSTLPTLACLVVALGLVALAQGGAFPQAQAQADGNATGAHSSASSQPPRRPPAPAPSPHALAQLRTGEPLDVNAASAADLRLLPGIGPRLAERIVSYRGEHGPFARIEALTEVQGIGARTLERLRSMISAAGERGINPKDLPLKQRHHHSSNSRRTVTSVSR